MEANERSSRLRPGESVVQIHRTNVFEVSLRRAIQPFRSKLDWTTVLRVTLEQRLVCPGSRDAELYRAVAKEIPAVRELTPGEHLTKVRVRVTRLLREGPPPESGSGWDRNNIALLIQVLAPSHPARAAALCAGHPRAARKVPVDVLSAVQEWALRKPASLERLLASRHFGGLDRTAAAEALGPRVLARALASENRWVRARGRAILPFLASRDGDTSP